MSARRHVHIGGELGELSERVVGIDPEQRFDLGPRFFNPPKLAVDGG